MDEREGQLLDLKIKISQLELERLAKPPLDAKPSAWNHPFSISVVGALSAAVLAIINNWWQANASREVERTKLESSLILKAMESTSAAERNKTLVFLLDSGLISDTHGKIRKIPEEDLPFVAPAGPAPIKKSSPFAELVPIPTGINKNLSPPNRATLMKIFGPLPGLRQEGGPVLSEKLKGLVEKRNVGPFEATGLSHALDVLTSVLAQIKSERPDLYAVVGSAGMLAYRANRASINTPSNHAYGLAIDLTIAGEIDMLGDDKCQRGLAELAGYFNDFGFYWGGGYIRPDCMHFEIAEETLRKWIAEGRLK